MTNFIISNNKKILLTGLFDRCKFLSQAFHITNQNLQILKLLVKNSHEITDVIKSLNSKVTKAYPKAFILVPIGARSYYLGIELV